MTSWLRIPALALLAGTALPIASLAAEPTLEERVAAQRAIEVVYWRHRIWPGDNATPKPPLDAVLPESAIRARVQDYLAKSAALERRWGRPLTRSQLQAELDRMARRSRNPRLLGELFAALGHDAELAAETLARPALAERLTRNWADVSPSNPVSAIPGRSDAFPYRLPSVPSAACVDDTWSSTFADVPDPRHGHVAVWTGTEMIVWGGESSGRDLRTGGRYDPATDTWTATSIGAGVPPTLAEAVAVWTGTEMVVWGGRRDTPAGTVEWPTIGGRYNPASDTWTPTSTDGVPPGRPDSRAVWTGTEMIVWGGWRPGLLENNGGGRYRPDTDTWTAVSLVNAPQRLSGHTVVWTGTQMVVWGGRQYSGSMDVSGGRYDPGSDSWTPTSTLNAPVARWEHTAVWTGTRMIVWGGRSPEGVYLSSGARYDPVTDTWFPTSSGTGVPSTVQQHVAVWTGSRMIVWGAVAGDASPPSLYEPVNDTWTTGAASALTARHAPTAIWSGTEMIVWGGSRLPFESPDRGLNTGARYHPGQNDWTPTALSIDVPSSRLHHTAVWTGTEMIVWGGVPSFFPGYPPLNTGGRYLPATDSWVPSSTAPPVPSPREGHMAVWTGREMIVWGGSNGGVKTNTGGRYDPSTDTWTPTSTGSHVPPPMDRPGGVWTGTEMILWGPGSPGGGGRYDPGSNTWRAMAPGPQMSRLDTNLPALWTGSEMLVWPGAAFPGGRYDPVADSWSGISASGAPPGQWGVAFVWTGTEMIIWGGCCDTNAGGRYDPQSDSWTPASTGNGVPSRRQFSTGVWTGSEMLIWGGEPTSFVVDPLGTGGRYDPSLNQWTPISAGAGSPTTHYWHTAVWTGTEMIAWGGEPGSATGGSYCACPSGALFHRDLDADGFGVPGVTAPSCDGVAPIGYVADAGDCDDGASGTHPGAPEICNGVDDDCNALVDESSSGVDSDADLVHDACDNCPFFANAPQSDSDQDAEGDACDLDDGLIWEWRDDASTVSWQGDLGFSAWNVYFGDLDVLRATGLYTQAPGSNPLASRRCGVTGTTTDDLAIPGPGKVSFSLVTGTSGGVESSLGSSTTGPRPNANPCP